MEGAGIRRLILEGLDTRKAIQDSFLPLLAGVIPEKIAINLRHSGRPLKEGTRIFVNGYALSITNRSLELLLQFAVTLKRDGTGWVHKEDILSRQPISRPRSEIRDHTISEDANIIENDVQEVTGCPFHQIT
nr:hypothetical protein [Desulfobacterales bacterium]